MKEEYNKNLGKVIHTDAKEGKYSPFDHYVLLNHQIVKKKFVNW